jgi:hypothetical protein
MIPSIPPVERVVIIILLAIVTHIGTYAFGWSRGYSASQAKWDMEKKAMIADANRRAAELRAEGSRLSAELEIARANTRIEYVEVVRGVQKVASSTRRAIDANLAGLLNSMSGIRETTERVDPPAAPEARREAAANPGRPDGVSERTLSEWIAGAVKSHEDCRAQANSLIEYAKACSQQ